MMVVSMRVLMGGSRSDKDPGPIHAGLPISDPGRMIFNIFFIDKKRKEEEKLKKIENEKRERRERSAKAFENWVERSKYNPRPVPLNMGAESM